jgi:hypothetical protein
MIRGRKIVACIKGGLGNQLFIYAAAKRLAVFNQAELVLDTVSGFERDHRYKRSYMLGDFAITARQADGSERLAPFGRYRRAINRRFYKFLPFNRREFLEQEISGFDERLLHHHFNGCLYFEGYWQSERYFCDISDEIKREFVLLPTILPDKIGLTFGANAVALHVRWFDPEGTNQKHNAPEEYYTKAIALIESKVNNPHYYLFSDNPPLAAQKIAGLTDREITVIDSKLNHGNDLIDFKLMSGCSHFIIANSTFSWWAAWLAANPSKMVIAPDLKIAKGGVTSWGFDGLIPERWILI